MAKYAHRYGVSIEWLVTGNYLGDQNGIALSGVLIRLSQGHAEGFFMHGCFPNRRHWHLGRTSFLREGYRVVSPAWLDPWLVCAKFLGRMHRSDDDPEYKRNSIMKDIGDSLKSIVLELRHLRPLESIPPEAVSDAELRMMRYR